MVALKIFSIIKFSNKIILAMMLFLDLDILSKCALFGVNAIIYHEGSAKDIPGVLFAVIPVAPVTLLSIAVLINLNNWIFYYIKIGEMASYVEPMAA
jgi:hypothetical protein